MYLRGRGVCIWRVWVCISEGVGVYMEDVGVNGGCGCVMGGHEV